MALNQAQLVNPPVGTRPGGVKAGSGITISADGTISASATGGGDIPAGAVMLFIQAAAPTGWTKSTTNDNVALRLVSGTGGATGGSVAFTTAFASQPVTGSISLSGLSVSGISVSGTVGATTLATTQIPAHGHSYNNPVPSGVGFNSGSDNPSVIGSNFTTGSSGGGQSHTHSFSGTAGGGSVTGSASFFGNAINMAVQYVDIIACIKD